MNIQKKRAAILSIFLFIVIVIVLFPYGATSISGDEGTAGTNKKMKRKPHLHH